MPATPESRCRDIYNANVRTLGELQRVNDEKYDQTLATLSAAFLGASVSFLTGLVPLPQAVNVLALYTSWVVFGLSTALTLVSYPMSNRAIAWHVRHLSPNEDPAPDLQTQNPWNRWTKHLNLMAGGLFLAGIGLTLWFAIANIHHQQHKGDIVSTTTKTKPSSTEQRGMTIPATQTGNTGQSQGAGSGAAQQQQQKPAEPKKGS